MEADHRRVLDDACPPRPASARAASSCGCPARSAVAVDVIRRTTRPVGRAGPTCSSSQVAPRSTEDLRVDGAADPAGQRAAVGSTYGPSGDSRLGDADAPAAVRRPGARRTPPRSGPATTIRPATAPRSASTTFPRRASAHRAAGPSRRPARHGRVVAVRHPGAQVGRGHHRQAQRPRPWSRRRRRRCRRAAPWGRGSCRCTACPGGTARCPSWSRRSIRAYAEPRPDASSATTRRRRAPVA